MNHLSRSIPMTTKLTKSILSERNFTILNIQPNQTILDFIDKHYKDQNIEYLLAFNGLAVLLVDKNQIDVYNCSTWFEGGTVTDISTIADKVNFFYVSLVDPDTVRENFKFFKNTILLPQLSFPNDLTLFELLLNENKKYWVYPRRNQSNEEYFDTLYNQLFTEYDLRFKQSIHRNESGREHVSLLVKVLDNEITVTLSEYTTITSVFDSTTNITHASSDNQEKIFRQPYGHLTEHGEKNYPILIQQVIKLISKFLSCKQNLDELEIFVNAIKYNIDHKLDLQDWEI